MLALLESEFAEALERLGPFGVAPRFAVGVSGGADSMALALLVRGWAAGRGASFVALIVDHGLRAGSGVEAALTQERLRALGVEARVLRVEGLAGGAGLQERARVARHAALARAARAAGAVFLVLGHHAGDQSETVAMRAARGTGGMEGMAGWAARDDVVLLRPLLGVRPEQLRDFLRQAGVDWVEDPSNVDLRFERVRVRVAGVCGVAAGAEARRRSEAGVAEFLARHVVLRPQGFAVVGVDAAPAAVLAALLRVVGGAAHAPRRDAVARLAAGLRPATLGGVRVMPAGRWGPGWLLVREPAACAAPIAAVRGAVWDGRFRLLEGVEGAVCGALGADAANFRKSSDLPAVVLRGLPCLRSGNHLGGEIRLADALFAPPGPAAGLPFLA